ncbi:MAG: helix-turn-helix domain-containing protein [Bacteroidales bacterium]|nr:helix-turn-helix domain-containing protein [Bacteroidales bacterium]
MEYENIISAFGRTYLKGDVRQVWVDRKFCMLDNLEQGNTTAGHSPAEPIRYPVRITMSFCIYCKEGSISARVQQKDYNVSPGGLLVIFAGQILEYTSLSEDCKVIFFAIDSDYIMSELRNRYGKSFRNWLLRSKVPMMLRPSAEDADNFEQLCRCIKFIVRQYDKEFNEGILSGFTAIIGNLLINWSSAGGDTSDEGYSNAEKVLSRFQSDIYSFSSRFRTVEYYARRQNLSARHFSRLVKEASGRRPLDIIKEYVILEAKSLLASEKYSVHETAEKLGFQNDSFFNRYFRNATGVTPGDFMLGCIEQ